MRFIYTNHCKLVADDVYYFVCTYRFKHIRIELVIIAVESWSNVMRNKRILVTAITIVTSTLLCTNNFLFEITFEYIEAIKLDIFRIFEVNNRVMLPVCLWRLCSFHLFLFYFIFNRIIDKLHKNFTTHLQFYNEMLLWLYIMNSLCYQCGGKKRSPFRYNIIFA